MLNLPVEAWGTAMLALGLATGVLSLFGTAGAALNVWKAPRRGRWAVGMRPTLVMHSDDLHESAWEGRPANRRASFYSGASLGPIREINGTTVLATPVTQILLVYDTSSFEVKSCKNLELEGTILANSFFTSSDRRLKKNIEPFPSVLEHIKNTHPVKFQWRKDDRHDYGFIAQEFYKEFDFLKEAHNWEGDEDRDKFYSMEYPKITAILFKAVQELNEKVELLTKKNI
jgi:hypothetical protein